MNKLDELSECRAKRDLLEDDRIRECAAAKRGLVALVPGSAHKYTLAKREVA